MVCELYKKYVHPLVRVVRGVPISWEPNFATAEHSDEVQTVAWSSCSRFIAVGLDESTEVLDAVTLERLHTFTHDFSEVGPLIFSPDSRLLTQIDGGDNGFATWDLQTGGRISVTPLIPHTMVFLAAYSMDGKVLAVAGQDEPTDPIIVSTYNLISGTHIYSHHVSEGETVVQIWTHGEFLRFATTKPGSFTIWEVGFTSDHMLAKIESLPAPSNTGSRYNRLFLPTLSRLAFILDGTVVIWDVQDFKLLLFFLCNAQPQGLSFSSDGRFFVCGFGSQGVHLWKESPTGYVLHQKLVFTPSAYCSITPYLSPDGESIITPRNFQFETQLRRTTDPINSPSGVPPQPAEQTDFVLTFSAEQNNFVLAFSADKSFIATGRLGRNIATIVDLKSGDPRLIVDTGMMICGLGVTVDAVVVVGEGKAITWNLPAGDCVLDARANIHDSVRTIVFNHPPPPPGWLYSASISLDFTNLVITREKGSGIDIYDASTGKHLVGTTTLYASHPWFTRDGHEVWYSKNSGGRKIIRGEWSDVIGLEPVRDYDGPSGGCPWESSHGHEITDDGWILDSRKKRVMWLPHRWRSVYEDYRIWDGRFLALFDPGLPEPVVIELYE